MPLDPLTGEKIPNNATMAEHTDYVWRNFITKSKCPAKSLAVVAHSAGGRVVASLFKDYKKEFLERVRTLVFTDAYYHEIFKSASKAE